MSQKMMIIIDVNIIRLRVESLSVISQSHSIRVVYNFASYE